jgi:PAS domain S-box-containing protein
MSILSTQQSCFGLRSIYEKVDHPIFVIDIDAQGNYRYADFNPVAKKNLGLTSDNLRGRLLSEVLPPEFTEPCIELYDECVKAGKTIHYEKLVTLDGEPIWWLTGLTPLKDDNGHIYRLVGTCTNITKRKQFEQALQDSETRYRQLAQRESLLNSIASQIRASLDFNTVVETAVDKLYHLLELERCVFRLYVPDAIPPVAEVIAEVKHPELPSLNGSRVPVADITPLIAKITRKEVTRIEDTLTLQNPVERQFFLETLNYRAVVFVPVHTQSGKIGAICCSHSGKTRHWNDNEVDLLERVADKLAIALTQAELYAQTRSIAESEAQKAIELTAALQQLQQTQAQLIQQEKMSSLGQLVAGVAHEINNPVSFIYGNINPAKDYIDDVLELVQLYQQSYPNSNPIIQAKLQQLDWEFIQRDFPKLLDSIKIGADRIRKIVQSLRNFSRLDEAEMKTVDLHEGIDNTLLILENRWQANPNRPAIQVVKDYGDLPLVECYAGEINQVFMNLLINAIDALESAFVKQPRIEILTQQLDDEMVAIRVRDNGLGIPAELKSRVFEPFFTTKPVGKGTGLGLSISYKIVEKHGGTLDYCSQPGKGTEFVVKLPRSQKQF